MDKNVYRKWIKTVLAKAAVLCLTAVGFSQPAFAQEAGFVHDIKADPICCGQKLGNSVLSGTVRNAEGTIRKGTIAWQNPEEVIPTAGTYLRAVVFTPETPAAANPPAAPLPEKEETGTEGGTAADGMEGRGREDETAGEEGRDAGTVPPPPADAGNTPEVNTIMVSVLVKPAPLQVQEWPVIEKNQHIYDGDILREVVSLLGEGSVINPVNPNKPVPVSGKFRWENPDLLLETGTQTVTLNFEPTDSANYEKCVKQIELVVQPRPVALQLQISNARIKTGQEVRMTAEVNKDARTEELNGTISFLVNEDTVAEGLVLEKAENGFRCEAGFKAQKDGEYEIKAVYSPKDSHTDRAESRTKKVTVTAPVSAFLTRELPEGREGKDYEAVLETDGSGTSAITFTITGGSLPKGISLQENSGKITGIPKESGEFWFTVEAAEDDAKISKEFRIIISEKEKLAFSVVCKDVNYGEKVEAVVRTARNADLKYQITFEGISGTKYEKSETAPKMPGNYRVKAVIEEPEDFAGQEVFQDFVIRKAKPKLTFSADPKEVTGGGDVTLKITVENPYDAGLKTGLPAVFSVRFDSAVGTKQGLSGREGNYTYLFTAENKTGKIRCTVKAEANDCYEAAEANVDVETRRKEEPEQTPSEKPKEEKPKQEPEKKKEEEPVKKTPEEMEAEFWQDIIFRIYRAQDKGDTVTINAKGHKYMPEKVMEALRGHAKVTLALVWEGDMIVIPAGKAQAMQKSRTRWTLEELSKLYPFTKPAAVTPQPAPLPKPAESSTVQAENGQAAAQGGKKTGGNKGGVIVHEKPETEAAEPSQESQESQEESTAAQEEEVSLPQEASREVLEPEETKGPKQIDWFLVAACICAGTGVIAISVAIAAMIKKRR